MKNEKITLPELKSWLDEKRDFMLVDLLPPEYFAEKHIAGAINAPVYEVVFLDYLEKLAVPKNKAIVVYSESPTSLTTMDAKGKLAKAGFEDVYEFPGGLGEWEEAGYPIEKGAVVPVPRFIDGEYQLDVKESVVGWIGRNAKYAHRGKIAVKSGHIVIENEKVIGGEIVLDMTTIKNDDLTDDTWRGVLESHLKSLDFFDTNNFGEACFEIKRAKRLEGVLAGTPNYEFEGQLAIKEVKRPIEFLAMLTPIGEGLINGQAHFDFDRTLWNVRYGSEKFFEKLGMHLVNDMVSLEIFLVAKK